jgi:rod shape-determining protein MreC
MANINSVVRKKQRRREKRREKEKKERININIDAKYFLYLLIFLCAISAYFSYVYQDKFAPAKTFVGSILTPMQNGINTAGKYISDKKELLKSKEELILENAKLKEQVASLEALNIEYITDTAELSELRELYSVGQKYSDYPMVAATVISRDSTGLYDVFTVNKGSKDGIKKDMNVIAGNGLVGIVTEVGSDYCKIRSIIDDTSYVSVMSVQTSDTFDLHGDLEMMADGVVKAENISIDAKLKDGDEVVTSYISDKYLQGILVGYVSDIKMASDNMTKIGIIKPASDFMHINNVLIITELKQGIAEE